MKKIVTSWHESLQRMLSLTEVASLVATTLSRARALFYSTTALFLVALCAHFFHVSALELLCSVPVPLCAILLSPFYLPLLIQAYDQDGRRHNYWNYVASSVLFYVVAGAITYGIWHLWTTGSPDVVWTLLFVGIVLSPLIVFGAAIGPFVMFNYSYDPLVTASHARIWRHGIYMTICELPFIILLLVYLAPFGAFIYKGPGFFAALGWLPERFVCLLMHGGSVLYWQVGWALAIVYYQRHKKEYL